MPADPRLGGTTRTANEEIQHEAIRHAVFLERLKNAEAKKILRFYDRELLPDLIDQLRRRLERKAHRRGIDPGPVTTKRMADTVAALSEIVDSGVGTMRSETRKRVVELAKMEIQHEAGVIRLAVPTDLSLAVPSTNQVRAAIANRTFDGLKFNEWFGRTVQDHKRHIKRELRIGLAQGQTNDALVKRLRGRLKKTERHKVEALARTSAQFASNEARGLFYRENTDLISEVLWIATLDTRTCLRCGPLDGQTFKPNEGPRPPLHPNCRCTTAPMLKSLQDLGIDQRAGFERTQLSNKLTGTVPATVTWEDWLKGLDDDEIDESLGPVRARAYRAGRLSVDEFTQDTEIITIADIKARSPGIFGSAP